MAVWYSRNWKAAIFHSDKIQNQLKNFATNGASKHSTRDLAAKKVKPVDTFEKVSDNFIVIH